MSSPLGNIYKEVRKCSLIKLGNVRPVCTNPKNIRMAVEHRLRGKTDLYLSVTGLLVRRFVYSNLFLLSKTSLIC